MEVKLEKVDYYEFFLVLFLYYFFLGHVRISI